MKTNLEKQMKDFLDWYTGSPQGIANIGGTFLIFGLKRFFPEAFPPPTIDECDIVELRRRAHAAVDSGAFFTTAARLLLTGRAQ